VSSVTKPDLVVSKHAPGRTQRRVGIALLAIAGLLVTARAFSAVPNDATLSVTLLAIAAIMALGVSRTPGGGTSLIGLFFLTTVVFNLGRPILWLIFGDESLYELALGLNAGAPGSVERSDLLLFWCIGIASLAGGYFASYRVVELRRSPLPERRKAYCRDCFWITLVIIAISIPVAAESKLAIFIREGYPGLYASQTSYSFSWFRSLDFLLPALFGLAVLLRESIYMRLVAVMVALYAVTGLFVGQRAAVGQVVLVAVWYLSVIRRKGVRKWLLVSAGAVLIVLFQFIAGWREGDGNAITLAQFMVDQGVTFLLPASIGQLPFPQFHTILGSFIPLGAVYSTLGVGTAADRSLGNYLNSQLSIAQFEQGYGLGSTFYLELFYLSGAVWTFYLAACALSGVLLRKWEESSLRSDLSLLFLCMCVSNIVFLPRGTISAITSQIIYASVYMLVIYLVPLLMVKSSSSTRSSSSVGLGTTAHA